MSATRAGCYGYKQRGLVRCDPRDSCPSAYGPSWSWALEWQVGAHVGRSACPGTVPEPAVRQPSREYGARSPKNELPCASSFPSPLSAPRWDNYPLHAVSIDMNLHLAPTQP